MKKYTKIICILDRSGSMDSIISDAIGGFNSFLQSQKDLEGDAIITTHLFDDEYQTIYENIDIKNAEKLNNKTYVPRGSTALYDAIGKSLSNEIDLLSKTELGKRPEKTLCIILTDGYENASREYNREKIKNMIEEMREEFNWEFIFLAANQDASLSAEGMGISTGNSYTFVCDSDSVNVAYTDLNQATTTYRTCSSDTDTSKLFSSTK
jgi:hypothetical protein